MWQLHCVDLTSSWNQENSGVNNDSWCLMSNDSSGQCTDPHTVITMTHMYCTYCVHTFPVQWGISWDFTGVLTFNLISKWRVLDQCLTHFKTSAIALVISVLLEQIELMVIAKGWIHTGMMEGLNHFKLGCMRVCSVWQSGNDKLYTRISVETKVHIKCFCY